MDPDNDSLLLWERQYGVPGAKRNPMVNVSVMKVGIVLTYVETEAYIEHLVEST